MHCIQEYKYLPVDSIYTFWQLFSSNQFLNSIRELLKVEKRFLMYFGFSEVESQMTATIKDL